MTRLLIILIVFFSACKSKEKEPVKPDIAFDKSKWHLKEPDGDYSFRKQMVKDIVNRYKWEGVHTDSLVQMLGEPDAIEEGSFVYYYEKKKAMLGTAIEAITFEIAADSTIKKGRFSDNGWD